MVVELVSPEELRTIIELVSPEAIPTLNSGHDPTFKLFYCDIPEENL